MSVVLLLVCSTPPGGCWGWSSVRPLVPSGLWTLEGRGSRCSLLRSQESGSSASSSDRVSTPPPKARSPKGSSSNRRGKGSSTSRRGRGRSSSSRSSSGRGRSSGEKAAGGGSSRSKAVDTIASTGETADDGPGSVAGSFPPKIGEGEPLIRSALCRPAGTRPLGCAPLLAEGGLTQGGKDPSFTSLPSQKQEQMKQHEHPLPCLECGDDCPYVKFRCPKGHTWKATSGSVACFFCPFCASTVKGVLPRAKTRKLRLEDVQAQVAKRGGVLLNTEYKGINSRLDIVCKEGHSFSPVAYSIMSKNSWCEVCESKRRGQAKRLTTADMHATAAAHGLEFVSPTYEGSSVKHLWRCAEGHEFRAAPNMIRRKPGGKRKPVGCPICRKEQRANEKKKVDTKRG